MKKSCTAVILALAFLVPLSAAPLLDFSPSAQNVSVGDSFFVDINITGVTDLWAWEVGTFDFGPIGLLNVVAPLYTEGAFFTPGVGVSGTVNNAGAQITSLANSFSGSDPGVTGSGTLVRIYFQAMTVGTANLGLADILLLDSFLDPIVPDVPGIGSVTISDASIPEPSSLALLAAGLCAAGWVRRRSA